VKAIEYALDPLDNVFKPAWMVQVDGDPRFPCTDCRDNRYKSAPSLARHRAIHHAVAPQRNRRKMWRWLRRP
jgi:hypothetical protein